MTCLSARVGLASVLCLACLVVACDAPRPSRECTSARECAAGQACVDSRCVAGTDAGALDAGPPDGGSCAPGQVRAAAGCENDCGSPDALACGAGEVCDIGAGVCAPEGSAGVLSGPDVPCGEHVCRAGTECSVDGECEPIGACARMACAGAPDARTCWGRVCAYERPAGSCGPASVERMNMPDFLLGGDGGAFDLEFDDACFAYSVTMISGTDYLRQLAPDGELTIWDGVTNLNMGEVAVLRAIGGEFGTGEEGPGEVALTYVCCAACGCIGSDPQGVARLDREGAASLPMVVEATPSTGAGPWGRSELDTGPYGLTWGRDRTLYVGNVTGTGDLVRASLADGTSAELHRFDARIVATAVFGAGSLLVALEGGQLMLASASTSTSRAFATLEAEITSVVRDPLTGHVFVALASGRIAELGAGGAELGTFADLGAAVRIAYAPDGYIYALDPGWPRPGAVTRHALSPTR